MTDIVDTRYGCTASVVFRLRRRLENDYSAGTWAELLIFRVELMLVQEGLGPFFTMYCMLRDRQSNTYSPAGSEACNRG